jgi:hypothetical protein
MHRAKDGRDDRRSEREERKARVYNRNLGQEKCSKVRDRLTWERGMPMFITGILARKNALRFETD